MKKLCCIGLILLSCYEIRTSYSDKNTKTADEETIALHQIIKKLTKEKKKFDKKVATLEAEVAAYQQAFTQHGISLD